MDDRNRKEGTEHVGRQGSDRRKFMKTVAVAAAGLTMSSFAGRAMAQSVRMNPAAKAVLPDGRQVSRSEILRMLNLDPATPMDSWLTIVSCGTNAMALKPNDAKGLIDRRAISEKMLSPRQLQQLKILQKGKTLRR